MIQSRLSSAWFPVGTSRRLRLLLLAVNRFPAAAAREFVADRERYAKPIL
jgi:hypothetical protein